MVFKRYVEGDVTKATNCKVAVYSCPLDSLQTETKVRVLPVQQLTFITVDYSQSLLHG